MAEGVDVAERGKRVSELQITDSRRWHEALESRSRR
jgi:hypothetical protein